MLRSKYKLLQLIVVIVFGVLFMVVPFISLNSGEPLKNRFILFILPAMSICLFYSTFQKSPRIIFEDEFLTIRYLFNKKVYNWSSIADIYLSTKENYMLRSSEATSIVFDNGDKLNIWQDIYGNCEAMRSYIAQKASDKIRDPRPSIKLNNLQLMKERRYAGNAYTSFNTLLIIGMAILMSTLFKAKPKNEILFLVPIGFILAMFIGLGTQMNYFLIDEGYLFIRNHYFPWKKVQIRLDDIMETDVETPNKRSSSLRIITKDFGSRLYGAGSLRNKHWKELMDDLKLIGIPVREDR